MEPISLNELEARWREYLGSENCPPILGLAPLSAEECTAIGVHVRREIRALPFGLVSGLVGLLRTHSAVTALWIARQAGEAYDGNFWRPFGERIGSDVRTDERQNFAAQFRRACRTSMSAFTAPGEASRQYVEEFLFQAGLPFCHSDTFASALRAVAEDFGLPEPDDDDAVDAVRWAMLARSEFSIRPQLRRAVEGPAGPLLIKTALRVVREEAFDDINPQLGRRLQQAFAQFDLRSRSQTLRLPFLRLSEDGGALEIVGPRQDLALAGSGVCWLVNGERFRTPATEDFVFQVENQTTLKIELLGLSNGRALQREVDLRAPWLLFNAVSRKQVRLDASAKNCRLSCGEYWMLHSAEHELHSTDQHWAWPDGERTCSLLALRPSTKWMLIDDAGETVCAFEPVAVPYLDVVGSAVLTDGGERIYYGMANLPRVWVPAADAEAEERWTLVARLGGAQHQWLLAREGTSCAEGLVAYAAGASDFLAQLEPALYEIEIEVLQRGRRKLSQTCFYWHGLEHTDGGGFRCGAWPRNLVWDGTHGFERDELTLLHASDKLPIHTLRFDLAGASRELSWLPPGTFLESFHRSPGHAIRPVAHEVGATFSAEIVSTRWLRISHVPPADAELLINGQFRQRLRPANGRSLADASLAELSTSYPTGGVIALRWHGAQWDVARFTSPLVPRFIEFPTDDDYECVVAKFGEPVEWVRPRLRDLVSGRAIEFEGREFSTSGHAMFESEGLPNIECRNVTTDWQTESHYHRVELDVPKVGWPDGIWLIEIDIRRDATAEWQPLCDGSGGRLPIMLLRPPSDAPTAFRAAAFWWAYSSMAQGFSIPELPTPTPGAEEELGALLEEIRTLLQPGYHEIPWRRLGAVSMLAIKLAHKAAYLMEAGSPKLAARLLTAAAHESGSSARSLFVSIPALLARPAVEYEAITLADPLRASLAWCANIAAAPRVIDGFGELIVRALTSPHRAEPGLVSVLRHFANFGAAMAGDSTTAPDLRGFDLRRYLDQTIGPIHSVEPAWDCAEDALLSRAHVATAIAQIEQRRHGLVMRREAGLVSPELDEAHAVFAGASAFRVWLAGKLSAHRALMPQSVWAHPWLDIDLPDAAFTGELARFASLFALAARAAAADWLSFPEVIRFLSQAHDGGKVGKAVATLLNIAPELLGYHLMLWELLIRTAPHD